MDVKKFSDNPYLSHLECAFILLILFKEVL